MNDAVKLPLALIIALAAGALFATLIPTLGHNGLKRPYTSSPAVQQAKDQRPARSELLILTNAERVKKGLSPLTIDDRLNSSSTDKCADMAARNYWSHNAPDGQQPWVFIKKYAPNYTRAGENLAKDYYTSAKVMEGWLGSRSHRVNLLDDKYTHVGFAICDFRESVLVVQHLAAF